MVIARGRRRRAGWVVLAVLFVALFSAATGPSIAQAPPSPTPFVVRLVVTDAACVPHVLVVPADIEVTGGFPLFKGRIVDVQRRIEKGWALGEVVLAGTDEDAGREMVVRFQNEHLVAIRDGEILASVPDLIAILDTERGEPITTEELRYGFRVSVIAMPCNEKWRTPAGIQLGGPRHFRYDIDFVPVEDRFDACRAGNRSVVEGVV